MKLTTTIFAAFFTLSTSLSADPIKPLFNELIKFDKSEFESFSGYLFKSWLIMDEDNPTYSLYINGIKYSTVLDDGRGTSRKASDCPKENVFDEDPKTGCAINFDGEYVITRTGASIEVKTKIWNVDFVE